MAKDCQPQFPMPVASADKRMEAFIQRTQAFIQVEAAAPDYLIGAAPGAQVLVMVRRSMAAPIDGANPGRATAPSAPSPTSVITPDWSGMPSHSDINGYFPDRALRMAISGDAKVRCTVGPKGDLLGCWVAAESPSGMGFGSQALELSTFVQMKPTAQDGSPTAGRAYILKASFDARTANITLSSGQQTANVTISHPVWLAVKVDMRYPEKAQYLEKEGQATVRCILNASLKPDGCAVIQEEPSGFGFGDATIKTVMQLQASPASSPGDVVDVPLKWRLK